MIRLQKGGWRENTKNSHEQRPEDFTSIETEKMIEKGKKRSRQQSGEIKIFSFPDNLIGNRTDLGPGTEPGRKSRDKGGIGDGERKVGGGRRENSGGE